MRARLRERAEWFWAPALYAGVVLLLYRYVLAGRWFGWDCIESFWPDLAYYAGALRRGEWPFWNPYDRGGYPFYADTHPGLYYPITWLFVGGGAAAGGMPGWVIQAKALAHHAIAGMVMHAYLRSRRLPPVAAAFGGVTAIVSLPMIVHKASALTWPMVWAPLIWLATDRLVERAAAPGWWRRAGLLGGAIALSGSAGPPPGFFYILLVSFAYGVWRIARALLDARRDGALRAAAIAQARGLAVAAVTALALLAIVVLPAKLALGHSVRAVRPPSWPFVTALPVESTLFGLVAPAGGRLDAYLGVGLLALVLVALALRPRGDRGAPIFFAISAAIALVLAFGNATPILPFLVEHVPGFGLFREPNRYKVLAGALASVVAAHGLAALLAADAARRRRALVVALAAVGALAAAALAIALAVKAQKGVPGYGTTFVLLAATAAVSVAVVLAPGRWRLVAAAAAVALAYVDVTRFADGRGATEAAVDDQEDRRFLAGLADVEREWRVYDEFVMAQRPGSRLGVRDFRGYPSGDPFEDARYMKVLERARKAPWILEVFNVRYVFHGAHHRNGKSKNFVGAPPDRLAPQHFRALDGRRFEALHPAPLVAWYGGVRLVEREADALAALERLEEPDGTRRVAIVERADVPPAHAATIERLAAAPAPLAGIAGRVRSYGANRIAVEIDAPAAGIVVLNEKSFPGWRVTVDGRPATPFRADWLLRAVVVEPGRHEIVWTYEAPRYGLLLGLWVGGVLFVLFGVLWPARPSATRGAATPAPPPPRP